MSIENAISIVLGLVAIIAAARSPAALLAYAQANKISTDRITELENKIEQQKKDFENAMLLEKDACREKINVLAGVIADLIKERTISKASKQKLNDKLSLITDPKAKKE